MLTSYVHWLVATSATFLLLERIRPWRRGQPLLRPGAWRDAAFVALNGHVFSLATAGLTGAAAAAASDSLARAGVSLPGSAIAGWPFAAQFAAFLLVSDLLQWCIHNLLHRVPWLWTFHKVHHSIDTTDWLGNWHFHWMEVLVYRSLQWLPLAWLGAPCGLRGRGGRRRQELRRRAQPVGPPVRDRLLAP